ncbi:hypothetical protein J1N35_016384 [Gossypium stocksii]|uniref:Uncharacterized protein n=1 Tax=Gossypium stocksii TaxID=47602 RepID=A0A9D3VL35_9ROSI|nr:hypothetical protein J1N35_016384 [Gossypium stocksii]
MAGGGGVFVFNITQNDAGEVALAVYTLIEMKLFCSTTRSLVMKYHSNQSGKHLLFEIDMQFRIKLYHVKIR